MEMLPHAPLYLIPVIEAGLQECQYDVLIPAGHKKKL